MRADQLLSNFQVLFFEKKCKGIIVIESTYLGGWESNPDT